MRIALHFYTLYFLHYNSHSLYIADIQKSRISETKVHNQFKVRGPTILTKAKILYLLNNAL